MTWPLSGKQSWLLLLGFGVLLVPLLLARPVFLGIETSTPDTPGPSASDLVQQSTRVTQFLVTLATGVFGLVGLMLADKGGNFPRTGLSSRWLIVGCVLTGLSLWTGFVGLWVVLQLGRDETVRVGLVWLFRLHMLELAELATGMGMIAGVFLRGISYRTDRGSNGKSEAAKEPSDLADRQPFGRRAYDLARAEEIRRVLDAHPPTDQ